VGFVELVDQCGGSGEADRETFLTCGQGSDLAPVKPTQFWQPGK
jgi:hypothetical protein